MTPQPVPVAPQPGSPVPPPPGGSAGAPTIADTSYRNYDGPLETPALRWWVIARATLRQAFSKQKGGYWIIVALVAITYLAQGLFFYFSNLAEKNYGINLMGEDNRFAATLYNSQTGIEFWVFVAALTIGASSISADNRANALLVYLAKPITRTDYLIGKWVGVFILLLALVLVPNVLMYGFFLGTYFDEGFKDQALPLFGQTLVASAISPAIHTSLILAFSAWSKTPRLAGAAYAAFYFILSFAFTGGSQVIAARSPDTANSKTLTIVRNASVDRAGGGVAQNIYKVTPQQMLQMTEKLGRRRNRRMSEAEQERRMRIQEEALKQLARPDALPVTLIALLYIGLPILASAQKVRAVEVIRG